MTRHIGNERGHSNGVGGVPTSAIALALIAGFSIYGYAALLNRRKGRPPDSAPARTRRGLSSFGGYKVVGRTVLINRPRQELYDYWRRFENLSHFMENIERVKPSGNERHVWTVKAPAGSRVEIETEITADHPGEHISWRSVAGSDVETKGRVSFREAPEGRGTYVEAIIAYKPPAGQLGHFIAKLFQREPSIQGRRELKRFKMLMETGEIANSSNRNYHGQE